MVFGTGNCKMQLDPCLKLWNVRNHVQLDNFATYLEEDQGQFLTLYGF